MAKGFKQQDYNKVFAPVGKYAKFRAVMATVASGNFEMLQIIVNTAVLQGILEGQVCLHLSAPGNERGDARVGCCLQKLSWADLTLANRESRVG